MAYQHCGACMTMHRDITPTEKQVILDAYTKGEAQLVSTIGIFHICILEIIGRSSDRNDRKRQKGLAAVGIGV